MRAQQALCCRPARLPGTPSTTTPQKAGSSTSPVFFLSATKFWRTTTPYSLYLQPEDEVVRGGSALFKPRRPAFTEILPIHSGYVGGDYYFERSGDPESPAFYFYTEVSVPEREALKKEDRRRLQIERVLEEPNAQVLVQTIVNFVVGGSIRRMQQEGADQRPEKYSLLFHTERKRESHDWQEQVAHQIREQLIEKARENSPVFQHLFDAACSDLQRSISLGDLEFPDKNDLDTRVKQALIEGELMITKVNSDKEINVLLDDDGELKLRTPFNLFIGGQILDRGITVRNLIGFYYGRNPIQFQQDTVLQHSRMYGARPLDDLPITRLYAPLHIYRIMKRIHEFDSALRQAFESGAHERGVYFIQRDAANQLVPCSPNKLMFSDLTTIRPGRRLLPVGFNTVAKSIGAKTLKQLDAAIGALCGTENGRSARVDVARAVEVLQTCYELFTFEDDDGGDLRAHVATLEHLSKMSKEPNDGGKVSIVAFRDRDIARYRESGRFSDAPDTKKELDVARSVGSAVPTLLLLRQNGDKARGWRDLPFWWPVILTPRECVTSVFASETPTQR